MKCSCRTFPQPAPAHGWTVIIREAPDGENTYHSLVRDQTSRGISWNRRLDRTDAHGAVAASFPANDTESITEGGICKCPRVSSLARSCQTARISGSISSIFWGTSSPWCIQRTPTIEPSGKYWAGRSNNPRNLGLWKFPHAGGEHEYRA